jgi:hypothetical protein
LWGLKRGDGFSQILNSDTGIAMKTERVIFGISAVLILAAALAVLAEAKKEAAIERTYPPGDVTFA